MHTPGYYTTNYRALSLRELVRMGGLFRLPFTYLSTRVMQPSNAVWMPGLWADIECKREELSQHFWQSTASYRQEFERLGFTECGFSKVSRHLNPNLRDNGGINYLDQSRCHFGLLAFTKVYAPPPLNCDREKIAIAFTVAFERGSFSYTNNKNAFDPLPHQAVIRLPSVALAPMYQRLLQDIARHSEHPRRFPDLELLRNWFDRQQMEAFQERADRRLFVRMNDEEIEAARRQMPPPLASTTTK